MCWCTKIHMFTGVYFYTFISLSMGLFPIDTDCGISKGCFSDCVANGTSYEISWSSPDDNMVRFTIKVELLSTDDQYAAFGLSATQSMADTSVSACIMTKSGRSFKVQNSYNGDGHTNSPVKHPSQGLSFLSGSYTGNLLKCTFERTVTNNDLHVFDLNKRYYMLYAKGRVSDGIMLEHAETDRIYSLVKVDLQSLTNTCPGKNLRIQIHGSLVVISWMIFANLGFIIARYYKALLPSKTILKASVWFLIHRILMVTAAVLTLSAFIIIIYDNTDGEFHVGSNNFQKSHPYIGILVFCFVIINPIVGLFRPGKDHRFRPVFYWTHCLTGCGTILLATINIFIGLRLKEAAVSIKAFYIFVAYECFHITMIVVLEVLKFMEKRNNTHLYTDIGSINGSNEQQEPEKGLIRQPFAWTTKLMLLCLEVIMTVSLSFTIVAFIVFGTH